MLNVASVGTGWVATHRHIPSLLRHPGVRLVGVVDCDGSRAAQAAAAVGPHVQHGDRLDVPWMREVQAVVLGTPPTTHHDLVLAALDRGLHVLTEKPFAMNPAEAREMVDAAGRAQRCLAVVHNFQFATSVARARARFASGEAGELRGVLGLQFSNPDRRLPSWYRGLPCGLFYDEAPHLFYLLRSFLGAAMPASVQVARSLDPADHTPRVVSTEHEQGGRTGSLQMFFHAALSEWHLVLMGSRETLIADIFRDILVRLPADHRHEGRDVLRTTAGAVLGHLGGTFTSGIGHVRGTLDYGNDEVVRRFVEAVQTGREPEGIAARDGLEVVEAMARVVEAAS